MQEDRLDALYRRFGPAINRRARALLRDEAEAWDVTQDTFLAYMRGEASHRGEASPFTVLYQIATYKAVDWLRRSSRWSGTLGSLDAPEEEGKVGEIAGAPVHEGGMARVEALKDLAILTAGEAPDTLTAAFLYYVEGYTLDQAGEVLELSRRTVADKLRRFAERARKRSKGLGRGDDS